MAAKKGMTENGKGLEIKEKVTEKGKGKASSESEVASGSGSGCKGVVFLVCEYAVPSRGVLVFDSSPTVKNNLLFIVF